MTKEVVIAKFLTITQHGAIKRKTQTKNVEYYNLDVIISVGYRIKSQQGTKFRQWATVRLREYMENITATQKKVKIKVRSTAAKKGKR